MWMDPRRSPVAFWRLSLQSDFKKSLTEKSTGGYWESTRGLQEDLQEDVKSIFGRFEDGKVGGKGS